MRQTLAAGLLILVLAGQSAMAADYPTRNPVSLPADVKAIFLAQMLGHVVSLDAIVAALGLGDYQAAAAVAGEDLGVSRFQEAGGEHLPEDFRAISARFRQAARDFAAEAAAMPAEPAAPELQSLIGALGEITAECRACHDAFRIE